MFTHRGRICLMVDILWALKVVDHRDCDCVPHLDLQVGEATFIPLGVSPPIYPLGGTPNLFLLCSLDLSFCVL